MNKLIDTDRLRLRQFTLDDFEAYAALLGDTRTMRYVGIGRPLSREEAWKNLAMLLGHWQLRGYGLYAVEKASSGALIGRVGLYCPEGWPSLEIGWLIKPAEWGRGYATEAARAVARHAFSTLETDSLISLIHPQNIASIKVAEHIGACYEKSLKMHQVEASLYRVRV